ncbi:regulator of G protein signaling superfamily [Basidiobolus meristosporus CBS 931.73]|uniref:Regulator of G protein signaling superfamily n=1 Tax=Basidiobolus meristosporus CBS 931.73 TaxID=1314790 RepID=A0A1Y1Z1J7_9FUNG|nr:regulator of G protein signaling superfamily [Basidiobolus meristosporus CBS 931.73]|eukprot:ORY04173.1 regulator of G protein signaling superfamily [Basidiobolus meristosporus CBS 931.73]
MSEKFPGAAQYGEYSAKTGQEHVKSEGNQYILWNFLDSRFVVNDPKLPTLEQILSRKTLPPVCLYNYYLFLRDSFLSVENLDFWLDVVAHENLCKLYCKQLLASLHNSQNGSRSFSSMDGTGTYNKLSLKEVSDELRFSTISGSGAEKRASQARDTQNLNPMDQTTPIARTEPLEPLADSNGYDTKRHIDSEFRGLSVGNKKVQRDDLRLSAEKIYYKYIVSGAEKELVLPQMIRQRISQMIESEHRDDPEVFLEAKLFVFDYMAHNSFPRFIWARAYSNIVTLHAMSRLVLGLFILILGFSIEFALIFLDHQPKLTRLWGFIPIWIGVLNIIVHQKRFSPLLTILGISEKSLLHFNRVKDSHIRHLHMIQALQITGYTLFISAAIVVVFYAVPGHRL